MYHSSCGVAARSLLRLCISAAPVALALQINGPEPCDWRLMDSVADLPRFKEEAHELGFVFSADACDPRLRAEAIRPHKGKPMLWVHIHKAGGSFMCGMALLNGEKVGNGGNCNSQFCHDGDGRLGWPKASCEQRVGQFQDKGLSWGQIEREFGGGDFCPWFFDYGITLRDPFTLALSEARMVKYTHQEVQDHLDCVANRVKDCTAVKKDQHLWRFFDNYQVRILGGNDTFFLPPGAVNKTHLSNALRVLSQFKVVLLFENMVSNSSTLTQALGWSMQTAAATDPHGNGGNKKWSFTDAQSAQIKKFTSLDATLHQHFRGHM